MELRIIGSSGALPFPKPRCDCGDCKNAKDKGIPYERISSSLLVYPDILIDTPEEVFRRLIQFDVKNLKHVFYTHWHPDHTQGNRLFEMWARSGFIGKEQHLPLNVYLPEDMIPDFEKYLGVFDYYKAMGYLKLIPVKDREPIQFGNVSVTPINLGREDRVRYAYLIEESGARAMYAPCSVFGTAFDEFWDNLDILFIETGWQGNTKESRESGIESWFKDHISLEENFDWLKELKPKRMILTHLEGSIHQTYDLIKEETDKYPDVDVAYDGMTLQL